MFPEALALRRKFMAENVNSGGLWGRWVWIVLVLFIVMSSFGFGWFLYQRVFPQPVVLLSEAELPDIENLPTNPGYLGIEACAPCHEKRVREFRLTNHANAIRVPDPKLMPPGFSPPSNRITCQPGLDFEMKREGNEFFSMALLSGREGKPPKLETNKIDFVYGWGRLDEVNFSWDQDRLLELPMAWLFPQETWGISSAFRVGDVQRFSREATANCLECHTTWFAYYPGSGNRYKPDSFLLGVTCERCHGPGKEHVAHHQAQPNDLKGAKIVAPADLPRERQLEICAQCHSNAIRQIGPPFSYRPGQPLDQVFRPIHTKFTEDDHVANQIKGLRQSKCFQKEESLTCSTCHNPHKPHGPEQADAGAKSCAKCHKTTDCREQAKLPEAVRGDCVGCHLPPRVWMNVNFHTNNDRFLPPIRRFDHRIAIHPESTKAVLFQHFQSLKDPVSIAETAKLKTQLVNYWTLETESRRENHRILAAIGSIREVLRVAPNSPQAKKTLETLIATEDAFNAKFSDANQKLGQNKSQQAVALFGELLKERPEFAMLEGKLGLALAMAGNNQAAFDHLKKVGLLDQDEPYGHAMMGWLDFLGGRFPEAVKHLKKADEIFPYMSKTNFHLGLALFANGQFAQAVTAFETSLEVDPLQADARQALSKAFAALGKNESSLLQARLAVKLAGDTKPDFLIILADAYAKVGDQPRFLETCRRGVEIARRMNNIELAVEFRKRLGEIR